MVRVAQPMPAQFTSDLSGAISTAASTAVITCSGLVTSVCTNRPPISLASGHALVLLEVGHHHAHAPLGQQT